MATEHSREEIIQVIKQIVGEGKQVSRSALSKRGFSPYWVEKLFPEGLKELKIQLGIPRDPRSQPLSDDELFEKLDKVISDLKSIPTWKLIRQKTGVVDKVWLNRSGNKGITGVFRYHSAWLKKLKPASSNLKLVDAYLESHGEVVRPSIERGG